MKILRFWKYISLLAALALTMVFALSFPLGYAEDVSETSLSSTAVWKQVATTGPSPRDMFGLAYDSDREVTVLFGGGCAVNDCYLNDTWEWGGAQWTQVDDSGPAPRKYTAMVYDRARRVSVLFGGVSDSGIFGDTWEWNGTNWTKVADTGPSPRSTHAMAYDSKREVVVLFGGQNPYALGDTWEWNGTSWNQVPVTGPSPRWAHAMAYDSKREVTVLFGGYLGATLEYFRDTWEWDGTSWTQVATSGPNPRSSMRMAYDITREQILLHGGVGYNWPQLYNDTWQWNVDEWELVTSEGPPRAEHGLVYDSARCVAVLFGGRGPGAWDFAGDTWELEAYDTDGDGIPDDDDACPCSDLSPSVVIDNCDSGVPNTLLPTGCTISDLLEECVEEADDHGAFVSCVAQMTNYLKKRRIITGQEKGAIQSCAAQANIP